MRLRACMLAIAVVMPVRAFAQTPAPPPAAPADAAPPAAAPPAAPPPAAPAVVAAPMAPATPAPAPAAPAVPLPKFTFGGLVDAYYLYNFIRADGLNSLTPPVFRAFDTNSNSATLALSKVSVNASMDPVSFQLDMGWGTTGAIINGFNTVPPGASATAPVTPAFLLEQAFGTISLPGALTIDFGKFVTTAGAEVIEANKNWLYSRSMLFNVIPLLHTGARLNLKVNDMLTLQGSIVNGWNNDPDQNAWKTVGLSASITASPMVSIIATTYFGKEAPQAPGTATPGAVRFLGDLVGAFTLSDKFGLNLNVDYIKAPDDVAADYDIGAALMGRYVVSDHLNVAARGEFLQIHIDGLGNTTQFEGTAMVGLDLGKNFELRPELRFDHSNDPPIYNTKNVQFTGTLAALIWF